jgi:hypothetical protein
MASCSSTNNYDIKPATNGQYNAIINIKRTPTSSCSAFVISDQIAVTAAHCMQFSAKFLKEDMAKAIEKLPKEIEDIKADIENLKIQCYKDTCDEEIGELTKLVIAKNKYLELLQKTERPTMYRVFDVYGNDTAVVAMAADADSSRDFGFIYGDFRKFNKLIVRTDFTVKSGDMLRSCGFANGMSPATCIDFRAIGQYGVYYTGESMIVPGMSGGPVINSDGEVVGINSRIQGELSMMAPTLGLFSVK